MEAKGEMEDLEGTSGELALLLYFELACLRNSEDSWLLLSCPAVPRTQAAGLAAGRLLCITESWSLWLEKGVHSVPPSRQPVIKASLILGFSAFPSQLH